MIAVAELIGSAHETIDPDTFRQASRERASEWLREARDACREELTLATQMAEGEPGPELLTISEGLDLLVLGSRGYGPLRQVLIGGVSSYLINRCQCPLIVAARGARPTGRSSDDLRNPHQPVLRPAPLSPGV